jgi:hypothetical protein
LHALRSEGRGNALGQLHQLCWKTALPSGARNSLPLRSQQARRARVELAAKRVRPQWTWQNRPPRGVKRHLSLHFGIISRQNTGGPSDRMQHTPQSLFPLQKAKVHLGPTVLPTRDTDRRSVHAKRSSSSVKFRACSLISSHQLHNRHSSLPLQHVANASPKRVAPTTPSCHHHPELLVASSLWSYAS